ncbi:hypothetical protein C7E25_13335 [Stenotrophomonas maltophilia]|nr:hypothetical protein C7E25_13335 [Stenotrophomonas maltophilia]
MQASPWPTPSAGAPAPTRRHCVCAVLWRGRASMPDGSTGPVTQHGNVGGALSALDQNVGTVNDRVDGLARDSLRWNESLGAYDAAHDGQATSQIANVAAGVNTTDAVNVGQLNAVDQAARAAQSTADVASSAAEGAQRTADDATARATAAQRRRIGLEAWQALRYRRPMLRVRASCAPLQRPSRRGIRSYAEKSGW